jgi:hypothetical protein
MNEPNTTLVAKAKAIGQALGAGDRAKAQELSKSLHSGQEISMKEHKGGSVVARPTPNQTRENNNQSGAFRSLPHEQGRGR